MSIEKLSHDPNAPLLTIQVKRGTPLNQIRRTVLDMMNEELKELEPAVRFDFDELEVTLDPPCCFKKVRMKYTELPLEDLSCVCGKTKLLEYKFI